MTTAAKTPRAKLDRLLFDCKFQVNLGPTLVILDAKTYWDAETLRKVADLLDEIADDPEDSVNKHEPN